MGTAEPWQAAVKDALRDEDVVFFNPRRDDWDSTIPQLADNPRFSEQVNWELDSLDGADIIVFYFDPNTKSPITLLELGLYAESGKRVIVCCPAGFWRKGNVDIVCHRHQISTVGSVGELCSTLVNLIQDSRNVELSRG